jgi:hypothetical protein
MLKANLAFSAPREREIIGYSRDHLRNLGAPWEEMSEYLEDLQKWRGQCDYDDDIQNLDVLVSSAIDTAEKILQQCR